MFLLLFSQLLTYTLITAVLAQIFIPAAEFAILTGIPTKESRNGNIQ